ncbi:hypothetical protein D3C84_1013860 [compost metagenome]
MYRNDILQRLLMVSHHQRLPLPYLPFSFWTAPLSMLSYPLLAREWLEKDLPADP